MPKRKDVSDVSEEEEESDYETLKPKAKKTATPKVSKPRTQAPKIKKPVVNELGWTIHPPSLIYREFGSASSNKIAAFDFDGTLVNVKSGAKFPKDAGDWKWYNKEVQSKVQHYHKEGYKIVIISNQGGIKSALGGVMAKKVMGRMTQVVEQLDVPVLAIMATLDDENRKPKPGMWQFMTENLLTEQPDKNQCFFVGDAAGREGDFSDSDKNFAANVGIEFKVPEDVFGKMDGKRAIDDAAPSAAGDEGLNPELVQLFKDLAAKYKEDKWKMISANKVSLALKACPFKITLDNLKEVGKIQGVGKASVEKISEYLKTGKVAALEETGGEGVEVPVVQAKPSAAKTMAMNFM